MKNRHLAALALTTALLAGGARASDVTLTALQFPEGSTVNVPFAATGKGPEATMKATVKLKQGQARFEIAYKGMEPALLFGGDVTAYVVWAVSRDGKADNLGELIVSSSNDDVKFSAGLKEFALMVTAESFPYVERPSEMVIFTSEASPNGAKFSTFSLSGLVPGPRTGLDSIRGIQYKEKVPIDVRQAERIVAFADRLKAGDANPAALEEAKTTLQQATDALKSGASRKTVVDYSRRAVSLASEAIRDASRRTAASAAAEAASRKKAELDALARKAAEAESARQQTEKALSETEAARREAAQTAATAEAARQKAAELALAAEAASEQARRTAAAAESARAGAEAARTESDKARRLAEEARAESDKARQAAEGASAQARADLERLAAEQAKIQKERDALASRLSGALSKVADTRDSARGVILSLSSGILFDVNKAVLKGPAREALAKLTGILLMLPDMNLRVEGYTDASGKDETNSKLSSERAEAVATYLGQQGIATSRISFGGYGSTNPVAPNDTADGRAKNRRVEVIIAEGEVKAAVR